MDKFKKVGLIFISTALHVIAGGIIAYFWQPIVSWYWNYRPVLGVDFYSFATYVNYLARNFALRCNSWKYIWWGGGPLFLDYPTLHAHLTLPLLRIFSLPQAVQAYMLGSCFLFLFFSYLLFWEISKDRVLAVVLTIASSFSIALYGPLVWGGSLPYFANQFFLPLVLCCLVKFFNTTDNRWFYLSSLFLGISLLGHPQVGLSYAFPISFLLLLSYSFKKEKFFSKVRFQRLFFYFLIAFIIGYPQLRLYLGQTPMALLLEAIARIPTRLIGGQEAIPNTALPGVGAATPPETVAAIARWQKNQVRRFLTDINPLPFLFLAAGGVVFLLTLILRKKRRASFKVVAFILPVLWIISYNFLYAYGIGIFHGGWYRAFWPFSLALGMLISFIWGDFWQSMRARLGRIGQKTSFGLIVSLLAGVIVLIPGVSLLQKNSAAKMLHDIEVPGLRQQSSAFPDSLNVYIEKEEFKDLKKRLVPIWLDPNQTSYRLYEADQRVNIWWNALYDMPLVKGYIDMPPGDFFPGVFYWTSIALSKAGGEEDSLVESWGVPPDMAKNNALFLIDWLSIKYIEAEHEKSDSFNPLTSYLAESEIFAQKEKVIIPGWAELYARRSDESGPVLWHPEEEEYLTFYEIKDEFVSPIAHTTDASTVGFIGRQDAYHTLIRGLAALNLNSKNIIPIRLGQLIDNVSYQSLKDMEAVVLYSYDYRNHGKAWGKLEKYVEEGGKVFIETGSDVKQTDSVNLPAKYPKELPSIFPIKMTKQEEMGKSWRLSGKDSEETKEISLRKFGPPVLNDEPWLFSQPNTAEDLKEEARVILENKGVPLIVSWPYGEGEVIWSGMNLPYHLTTHKNIEEAKLFKNLLGDLVDLAPVSYLDYEVERESSKKMIVKGKNARGVFFRENSNPGWKAELKSKVKSQKSKVYQAGPTFYGFSYVRIPEEKQDSFTVTFSYQGELLVYFWTAVSTLTIIFLLDKIILNSRLIVPVLDKVTAPLRKRVSGWWEKEEEY